MSVCLMSLHEVLVSVVASTASVGFVVAVVLVAAVVVASVLFAFHNSVWILFVCAFLNLHCAAAVVLVVFNVLAEILATARAVDSCWF